jgi:hypothetical protein
MPASRCHEVSAPLRLCTPLFRYAGEAQETCFIDVITCRMSCMVAAIRGTSLTDPIPPPVGQQCMVPEESPAHPATYAKCCTTLPLAGDCR